MLWWLELHYYFQVVTSDCSVQTGDEKSHGIDRLRTKLPFKKRVEIERNHRHHFEFCTHSELHFSVANPNIFCVVSILSSPTHYNK